MMEYKGYIGQIQFDEEAEIIHGEVINTRDVITFQGASVVEVKQAFHDSVDDYLAYCSERGESPEKPFSGQFITRISPELHRQVNSAAILSGKSLNAWVSEQLQSAVLGGKRTQRTKKIKLQRSSKQKVKVGKQVMKKTRHRST